MSHSFLSPKGLKIANEIMKWSEDYLIAENPNIKRPGPGSQAVCPFVKNSIDKEHFYMVFHPEVNGQNAELLETIMIGHMTEFKFSPPYQLEQILSKALLVIFPELPEKETRVLDLVHANIKSRFVANGFMVGQFHKRCDQRAIYNEGFKVNHSPHPLMAVRHMAMHDIVFLEGGSKEWFEHYNTLFGERFKDEDSIEGHNRHLIIPYKRAKAKFAQ